MTNRVARVFDVVARTLMCVPVMLGFTMFSTLTLIGATLDARRGQTAPAAESPSGTVRPNKVIVESDCVAAKLGTMVAASAIGEPVSGVTLSMPVWTAATPATAASCSVDGSMAPVDQSPTARPINFRVVLPASWSRRSVQLGGGGLNGFIPVAVPGRGRGGPGGPPASDWAAMGVALYGSDSGHQIGPGVSAEWALNDEAIKNLGYMQMKKTHDAAMVLLERMYGERPRFNYYVGTSQGGREALTVAQRYPADYDGVLANVPIVSFSTLMLAPEFIRIAEKPSAHWVTPAKVNAIGGEFIRQCDALDGLADGIINNYMACRAIFDLSQGARNRNPWTAKRCPNNLDPDPADTSRAACLTDGQISTLNVLYSRYRFAAPLANGTRSFGMWVPNTDPSGSGLILGNRFRGQEGAPPGAPMHEHLGVLGVTGFLMRDLSANPLDYVEGGSLNRRREQLSSWLDSTSSDLTAFSRRGGKMIVTIGTNDTLASPGAQLDYYQAILDKIGRETVDAFARLYVLPQTGHGLTGANYSVAGDGKELPVAPIPNTLDRVTLLMDWVERQIAPSKSPVVTSGDRTLPLCSYPSYPRYMGGPVNSAGSYTCAPQ